MIAYVAERYGTDQVSQIITFNTMAARAVVRDVGRALAMPFGAVDRIAKLIPFELGITLDKALAGDEELRTLSQSDDDVNELISIAKKLEGLARSAGTHAGGVVIAPRPLTEFMPLYVEPDGTSLTQLDKDDVEAIGLVKFDFLGLKTLTVIDRAFESINRAREAKAQDRLDPAQISMDDSRTFELLKRCQTTAVFQLESRGMRDLIRRLQPDRFGDLVAVLALFRPGPLQSGMVDDFINRKHGTDAQPVNYFHPSLEPILKPTYGVILYQEQVMQIAQVIAGYSLGGADLLRRAMGKKKPKEMAQQEAVFLAGAADNGLAVNAAKTLFDLMGKLRRLRLQQVAFGGLRADRLPDGVAEGTLSRTLHGGGAQRRHGTHRKAALFQGGLQATRNRSARTEPQRLAIRIRRHRGTHHCLRARRDQGCRP